MKGSQITTAARRITRAVNDYGRGWSVDVLLQFDEDGVLVGADVVGSTGLVESHSIFRACPGKRVTQRWVQDYLDGLAEWEARRQAGRIPAEADSYDRTCFIERFIADAEKQRGE